MQILLTGLLIYIVSINVISLMLYGIDKRKAILHKRRISEFTLISVAVLGGSVGALLAMQIFRHKTQHIKFYIGVPIILALQIFAFFYIIY